MVWLSVQRRSPVHHDLELVREMVIDVDLNETLGIPHHAEDRMMTVVVVGKGLAADEDQRLVAGHEAAQVVEVDLVALAMIEIHDGVGMPRWARFQRPKDEVVSTWAAKQHVAGRTAYQEIVAAQSLDRVVGTEGDDDVRPA